MTSTPTHQFPVAAATSAGVSRRHLFTHYVEMILAMLAGMVVLGTLRDLVGLSPALDAQPAAWYLLMATDMSLGMAAWMRFRGHGWPGILEMCAAMYVPAVLLPLVFAGVLDAMTFMVLAHVAMPLLMLAVLLRRRHEFGGQHH
jgi:flagellar biosynthetic protein FliP